MASLDIEQKQSEFDNIIANFGSQTIDSETTNQSNSSSSQGLNQDNSFILGENNDSENREKVTLTVSNFNDQNDGSDLNGLSLRDAILLAHSDLEKEYTIYLPEGTHSLSIQGNQDFLFQETSGNLGLFDDIVTRTGDLDIETQITIIGADPFNTIIDGINLGDRIFDVREGGFLTLSNVTVQNGTARGTFAEGSDEPDDPDSFLGGGIRIADSGSAIINSSIIKENRSQWDTVTDTANINGGGIGNRGFLQINDTTIIDNIADGNGGGIYNSGTATISNSSVINNSANANIFYVDQVEGGGGIQNDQAGTLSLTNSTISGNSTILSGNDEPGFFPGGAGGGGILSSGGQIQVTNSTIVNNTGFIGSGIFVSQTGESENFAPAIIQNSIVAENEESPDIEGFFDVDLSSHNIIGNGNGVLINGQKNNIVGDANSPIDPNLGNLAYNGGLTPTHAVQENSVARNGGSNEIASDIGVIDQRGKNRIIDGTVDIGSYEYAGDELLDTPLYRLQNTEEPGTYLFVNYRERQDILANYTNFEDEGYAFSVAYEPDDELMPIYRLQNQDVSGTYLFVTEGEKDNILAEYDNFLNEGLAFYVYGAGANQADSIYRFQNQDRLGTYLFVTKGERDFINSNFDNFVEEGIAWEANV